MSFKNKTQLINSINKVITSNNKSPTKKNLKKLDRMAKTNYSFLDQTGGAIMKETLNILSENYKNNYAIKPNRLSKNYIGDLLEQAGGMHDDGEMHHDDGEMPHDDGKVWTDTLDYIGPFIFAQLEKAAAEAEAEAEAAAAAAATTATDADAAAAR